MSSNRNVPSAPVMFTSSTAVPLSSSTNAPPSALPVVPFITRPRMSPSTGAVGESVLNRHTVAFPLVNSYPSEAPTFQKYSVPAATARAADDENVEPENAGENPGLALAHQ